MLFFYFTTSEVLCTSSIYLKVIKPDTNEGTREKKQSHRLAEPTQHSHSTQKAPIHTALTQPSHRALTASSRDGRHETRLEQSFDLVRGGRV